MREAAVVPAPPAGVPVLRPGEASPSNVAGRRRHADPVPSPAMGGKESLDVERVCHCGVATDVHADHPEDRNVAIAGGGEELRYGFTTSRDGALLRIDADAVEILVECRIDGLRGGVRGVRETLADAQHH